MSEVSKQAAADWRAAHKAWETALKDVDGAIYDSNINASDAIQMLAPSIEAMRVAGNVLAALEESR